MSINCLTCGCDLSKLPLGSACPACGGQAAVSLPTAAAAKRTSLFAIATFVIGLVSVPLAVCVPAFAVGFIAIALYFPAMGEVKRGSAGGPSAALAIAGLILGILSTLLSITCLGLFFIGEKYNWN